MMNFSELSEMLLRRLGNGKPMVVYHKPDSKVVRAWLPKETKLGAVGKDPEPGFVFTPFDPKYPAIAFPLKASEILEASWRGHDQVRKPPREQGSMDDLAQPEGFEERTSRSLHISLVEEAIDFIRSGKASKIVVARREETSDKGMHPLEIFKALTASYPQAFVYLWYHPETGIWCGASPEILLKVKDEVFHTMSLAGTRLYREEGPASWGVKELEEQRLVTELIREELKDHLTYVGEAHDHRAGPLVHLRTDLRGRIPGGGHPGTIIEKLHPTAAVCGIPRKAAMEFILNREIFPRAYYTGYLGEFMGPDEGESLLFVNLRCMQLFPEQEKAWIYVGGGITSDSDAEKEWEETVAKSETMKRAFS